MSPEGLDAPYINIQLTAGQTESIAEASRMKYPLHLAWTALQLFQLAAVRGFGKDADVAVCRVWDGVEEPTFPARKP